MAPTHHPTRFKTGVIRAVLAWVVLAVAGCGSLQDSAPTVAMLSSGPIHGNTADLEKGRDIYITRCAKCHSVYSVRKYSLSQWNDILPEMAAKAHLSTTDTRTVHDYILTVLNSGPANRS